MSEASARAAPLAGVRVLDLTRLLPGPVATLHLGDLGAEVVKIEGLDPASGDYARGMEQGGTGNSYYFRAINRNKRGLRLDLKTAGGVGVFMRLARSADIVVESFRPGVVDRLGIGYAAVNAVNPRIVYCSITGYGQTGPYARRAGHDLNYIGYAGVLDAIGVDGGRPAIPDFQIGDLAGGALTAAMGILAALFDARRSGNGRHVDVGMAEAVLAHSVFPLHAANSGIAGIRGGDMLTGGLACYGVYATADGRYMAVAPLEAKFWQLFCAALDRPDWLERHWASGSEGRALRSEIEAVFRCRTQAEWTAFFADIDCCVTPVRSFIEALADPQFVARGMSFECDGMTQLAPPCRISGWSPPPPAAAPALGEHNEVILRAAGFSDCEIAELAATGVI